MQCNDPRMGQLHKPSKLNLLTSAIMASAHYEIISYIRGYHDYQLPWKPLAGQILNCYQEPDNILDKEAVAVKENTSSTELGHVPQYFCKFVFRYLKHVSNTAILEVTGKAVNRGAGLGMEV